MVSVSVKKEDPNFTDSPGENLAALSEEVAQIALLHHSSIHLQLHTITVKILRAETREMRNPLEPS